MLSRGSLTQLLKQASAGQFRVEVVYQGWGKPTRSEAQALGIASHICALIREVRLYGADQSWVSARSVIPAQTLSGPQRMLRYLGNRPLGEVLFRDPSLERGPLQIARLSNRAKGETVWARRSVFHLGGKPLLVSEIFLPALLQVEYRPMNQLIPTPDQG